MKAVIMAGGKGTRLQTIASDIPKPMVPVLGKPIIEYQIESLKNSGVNDIILIIGHLGSTIREYFGDGSRWKVSINYIVEDNQLGTAGALYYLKEEIKEDFLLIFGDLILDIDWNRFMDFHKEHNGWITLFGHPNAHPYDSDVIVLDENSRVISIDSKNNTRDYYYNNLVNAGLYCVNPMLLTKIKKPEKIDLEKDLITKLIIENCVYGYRSTEYVKDMGTPERYYSVIDDVKKGIVTKRNFNKKQKCIFIDRDGTINVLKGFINCAEQFEFLPDIPEAIKMVNSSEYLVIVVTNQPVVARGECSIDELLRIHMKLETELGKEGAFVDDIFFCPHHPDAGFKGEVAELKFDCECRKPKIGMLVKAAEKYNIDLSQSWYIGDTTVDIKTGLNAFMHTILVHTGEAGKDGKYDVEAEYSVGNLKDAVVLILDSNIRKDIIS